jgi:hypothetical protein
MKVITIPSILLLLCKPAPAQVKTAATTDRSRFSIMVVPVSSGDENMLARLETDAGYKEAISDINSALINMGYRNTLDFKTHKEIIDKRHEGTRAETWSGKMKEYIEKAEVDMIIEAEIFWTDPPGNPRNRQARLKLKAVDKYTGAIYADNAFIQSMQREFPGLAMAVDHALTRDGAEQFNKFLSQLDASYSMLLQGGRAVNIKFELGTTSKVTLNDRIGSERLSDKLEECLQKTALHGRYRALGSSAVYMDFAVQVPVIDEAGAYVSPNLYLRKKIDDYFYQLGFEVTFLQVNNWINFILLQKSN